MRKDYGLVMVLVYGGYKKWDNGEGYVFKNVGGGEN